ncbi:MULTISPECIES: hypothetical protein [Dickeya]|uniref:Uncharacterized protein n=1 Tax=Dickeya aquatica TaxID=1401087 RepID=A0A375AAV4_9GAMM|nr:MULTISPECIES: hypothetical protein [Dickeya]SLM63244.1 hypothetical protein DAQ1742_02353 [Dickeya aquatica]
MDSTPVFPATQGGQEAEERTPPPTAEGSALRAAPHPRCQWRGRKT